MPRFTGLLVACWLWLGLLAPWGVEAQPAADKRLLQKTSVQAEAKPVLDVLRQLAEKHKLTVELASAVGDGDFGTEPFTLAVEGITLGSALNLACEAADLSYTIDKGRLLITTSEDHDKYLVPRDYALGPLGQLAADPQVLANSLPMVSGGNWKDIDGSGGEFVALTPRSLTIRQTPRAHAELEDLFAQLAAAATGRATPLTPSDRAEQTLLRKLQASSSALAGEALLAEVLDGLLKKNGIPYWVDVYALRDEGIDWSKLQVAVADKKQPTAARLDAMLAEKQLAWRVGNEVVQITTRVKSDEQRFAKVYDVRRLLTPNRSIRELRQQLISNKDLGEWEEINGTGGNVVELGTLLVVYHNAATHAKVAVLLK
jgi:hypothetical protein